MDNRQKQVKFAEYFKRGDKVLELGSGVGDFLSLCTEKGINAVGVDKNDRSGRPPGLKIIKKDILAFIKKEKSNKYDGVYARHLVEHFFPEQLRQLFAGIYRVMKKGGRLILVFPNMKNLHVATYEFWNDETHARPYTVEVIARLAGEKGFKTIKFGPDKDSRDNSIIKNTGRFLRKIATGMPDESPDFFFIAEK